MNNIGQEILDKIKEQNIQPKKRWEFLFKDYVIWLVFVLAIVLGSLASSVTIFMVRHAAWSAHIPNFHPLKRLLVNLPFFWLLSLTLFSILAWYDFKNTKRGYKYHPFVIVIFSVVLSIIMGAIIYGAGVGERLEDIFFRRVPFYHQMFSRGGRMFVEPDKGHLAGVVKSVEANYVTVEDFRGKLWQINTSTDQFYLGQRVILFGYMDDNNFVCDSIMPWLRPIGPPPPRFLPPQ